MVRLFKITLFLLLMWPLDGVLSELTVHQAVELGQCEPFQPINSVPNRFQNPSLPYWPAVELSTSSAHAHQVVASRIQRIVVTEYIVSVKSILQKLADRKAAVSQHQERIYDTTTSYFCDPASQYYIFTLRRILI